jgi:hypothetical protein
LDNRVVRRIFGPMRKEDGEARENHKIMMIRWDG